MMALMKWILIVIGTLVGLVAVAWLIGTFLPKGHQASRTLRIRKQPEAVWAAITDYTAMPSWREDLAQVERLPDHEGRPVWRETLKRGFVIPLETMEASPPRRLVRRIADPKLPFGGDWTYEIQPAEGGCEITITETGEVRPALFRLISRFTNQAATIEGFLAALSRRLDAS